MTKCPYKYKYELVEWYNRYYKRTNGNSKKKAQLYAIWYNTNPSMLKTTGPLVHRKRR